MASTPAPQNETPVRHQPQEKDVTAYDIVKLQENLAASIRRLQTQINALEARVAALEP